MSKIVIALGGNALQSKKSAPTAEGQLEVVRSTCDSIAEISASGYEIALVHGNGPQVGRILLSSETAADVVPVMPFDVCGAMSQGYIGYHIQQCLKYALAKKNINIPVVSLVTQMVVDENDPAFQNPTKPIGGFYTKEEADKLIEEKGYQVKEDAGRGYRRVVASPLPRRIVELNEVKQLWNTSIVVTCGGGGIPVIEKPNGVLEGVAAVIDKDRASAKLALDLKADKLVILTAVDRVAINFNKPDQRDLARLTIEEANKYIAENQFAKGSMLPKVESCMEYVENTANGEALITSLQKAKEALKGNTGTIICK